MSLDGVKGSVGRVAGVGRRRRRQRYVRLAAGGHLNAPNSHELHQLEKKTKTPIILAYGQKWSPTDKAVVVIIIT